LREEGRLRVFENRVLKRILEPKRVEVAGEWRKLRNEELNDMYSSPNIVRVITSSSIDGRGMKRLWGRREAFTRFGGETGGKETAWETKA